MKITEAQSEVLCKFFEDNPEVLRGYKKTQRTVNIIQAKWKTITPQLNALGPPRSYNGWPKYLSNVKTKLKRKRIKWRENSDGSGPIISNTGDFSQIYLRMLQVLKGSPISYDADSSSSQSLKLHDLNHSEDSQDTNMSNLDLEDHQNYIIETLEDPEELCKEVGPWQMMPEANMVHSENQTVTNSPFKTHSGSPEPFIPQQYLSIQEDDDEFDTFGKNISQQLRTLPLDVALETQELLLAVIRKQRMKIIKKNVATVYSKIVVN